MGTNFRTPCGKPIGLNRELQRRLDELGPDATVEELFRAIHQWAKEEMKAEQIRQDNYIRDGIRGHRRSNPKAVPKASLGGAAC